MMNKSTTTGGSGKESPETMNLVQMLDLIYTKPSPDQPDNIDQTYLCIKEVLSSVEKEILDVNDYINRENNTKQVKLFLNKMRGKLISGENPEKSQKKVQLITELLTLYGEKHKFTLSLFIEKLSSNEENIKQLLHSNLVRTKSAVNKRYRALCIFHPDKWWSHPKHNIFVHVFQILNKEKNRLLKELNHREDSRQPGSNWKNILAEYKKEAKHSYDIAIDWQEASKGNFSKLRKLDYNNVKAYNQGDMIHLKKEAASKSYEYYRAACTFVDQTIKDITNTSLKSVTSHKELYLERINIRLYIALVLRIASKHLDAQLYAVGAIQLILRLEDATPQEISKLLDKANKISSKLGNTKTSAASKADDGKDNTAHPTQASSSSPNTKPSVAVVNYAEKAIVKADNLQQESMAQKENRRKKAQKAFGDIILARCLAKPDFGIVSYSSSPTAIITSTQEQAYLKRALGVGAIAVSGAATASGAVGLSVGLIAGSLLFPPLFVAGLMLGGLGIFTGIECFKRGINLIDEPEIRENLNNAVEAALELYGKGKFAECLKIFSHNFNCTNSDQQKKLITLGNRTAEFDYQYIQLDAKEIRDNLLKHGFQPDAVAYILVLIGEILSSGQVSFQNTTRSAQLELANSLLLAASDRLPDELSTKGEPDSAYPKLMREARRLDKTVEQYLASSFKPLEYVIGWFKGLHIPKAYIDQCVDQSSKAPYAGRLREIQLTARLNRALIQFVMGGEDNHRVAFSEIAALYKSAREDYQYFTPMTIRLETLENLIVALGHDPENELGLRKSDINEHRRIKYTPNQITLKGSGAIEEETLSVRSFFTDLSKPVDILKSFCLLSNGLINLSTSSFLSRLSLLDGDPRVDQIRKDINKKGVVDGACLQRNLLEIMSIILNVRFLVYEQTGNSYSISITQPDSPPDYLFSACISFAEERVTPLMLFVEDKNPCIVDITRKIEKNMTGKGNRKKDLSSLFLEKGRYYINASKNPTTVEETLIIQEAQKAFEQSLNLNYNLSALWKIVECCLILGETTKAEKYLNKTKKTKTKENEYIYEMEYFYYKAVIQRKRHKYKDASALIKMALERGFREEKVTKEDRLITRLLNKESRSPHQFDQSPKCINPEPRVKYHDTLSIDGGGIRGIIPLMLLCHLERELRTPISSVYDMTAGTSTGGLIALGLSFPKEIGNPTPKYSAEDILNLYRTKSTEIFSPKRNFIQAMAGPAYGDEGRRSVCMEYYGETARAENLLTECLVPATLTSRPHVTNYFTRYEAKQNPHDYSKNVRIFDIAMATSAAPTYFPAHAVRISSGSSASASAGAHAQSFVDGGVQANNPSLFAYSFSINKLNIDPKKVRIVSLGTGDHVQSDLNVGSKQGLLFWARNIHHFLGAQQNDADRHLAASLGPKRYSRFQFWMDPDRPTRLDAVDKIDELVEMGREMIEERIDEVNQLVERGNIRLGR